MNRNKRTSPQISVILPVFNDEDSVGKTLESILNQSFEDFEFIIINDCSTDNTPEILKSYAAQDSRIRLFDNQTNLRQGVTTNRGLGLARSERIARIDGDDIHARDRFAKQMDFLAAHPEVDVCGTGYSVPETGRVWENAPDDKTIKVRMLFGCELVQPATLIKKSALLRAGGWPDVYPCDDYTLWVGMILKGDYTFANLPEPLIEYSWKNYLSGETAYLQRSRAQSIELRNKLLQEGLGLALHERDVLCHCLLCGYSVTGVDPAELGRELVAYGNKILSANAARPLFDQAVLQRELAARIPGAQAAEQTQGQTQ